MEARDYVDSLRRDGRTLGAAAARDLRADVPSCPGWDVRELVRHTGGVHRFWGQIVAEQLDDPSKGDEPFVPDSDDDLLPWFVQGVEWLARVLESADPSMPVWSWSTRKEAGFVQRRMAQETAVHRWDAQAATAAQTPIEAQLAADGVDEIFDTHMPAQDELPTGNGEAITLHQSDGDRRWFVRLDPEGFSVEHRSDPGDARVDAPASDLLLMLWGRIPPETLRIDGDPGLARRLVEVIDRN